MKYEDIKPGMRVIYMKGTPDQDTGTVIDRKSLWGGWYVKWDSNGCELWVSGCEIEPLIPDQTEPQKYKAPVNRETADVLVAYLSGESIEFSYAKDATDSDEWEDIPPYEEPSDVLRLTHCNYSFRLKQDKLKYEKGQAVRIIDNSITCHFFKNESICKYIEDIGEYHHAIEGYDEEAGCFINQTLHSSEFTKAQAMIQLKPVIKDKRIKVCMYQHGNGKTYVDYFNPVNAIEAFQRIAFWNQVCTAQDKPSIILEEGSVWLN